MTLDAIRAAFPAYPANESAVAIAYGELLGRPRDVFVRAEPRAAAATAQQSSLVSRLLGQWRAWRREREELARLDALAPLAPNLLRDIGISDEERSIAQARHASHGERVFRSSDPSLGAMSARFGSW